MKYFFNSISSKRHKSHFGFDNKKKLKSNLRFNEFHGLYWSISLEFIFQYGSVCEISKKPMYTYTSHIVTLSGSNFGTYSVPIHNDKKKQNRLAKMMNSFCIYSSSFCSEYIERSYQRKMYSIKLPHSAEWKIELSNKILVAIYCLCNL